MNEDILFGEPSEKIKWSRIAYFKISSEFLRVYEEMYDQLKEYVKKQGVKKEEITRRNEKLAILVNFYNASEELVGYLTNGWENAYKQEITTIEEDMIFQQERMMEYALKKTKEAQAARNWERVGICIDLFLRLSDISSHLLLLKNIRPEQPHIIKEGEEGFIFKAPKLKSWMKKGEEIELIKGYSMSNIMGDNEVFSVPGTLKARIVELETFTVEDENERVMEVFANRVVAETEEGKRIKLI